MITVRKIVLAAAVALGVAATDSPALAEGWGCNGPFCNTPKYPTLGLWATHGNGLFSRNKAPLPTFQAAPWYLYWPYDGHFMTPAPVTAPFYAPPVGGNFPVNPYFPAPAGQYGPIPGGPAPAGVPITPGGFGPSSYPAPPPPAARPQP
ncbi:MAG: hypothetical protein JWO38_5027 [Gemmataceae bacterium]|nr:hypothetical protein [Gemmataceae bacterium]